MFTFELDWSSTTKKEIAIAVARARQKKDAKPPTPPESEEDSLDELFGGASSDQEKQTKQLPVPPPQTAPRVKPKKAPSSFSLEEVLDKKKKDNGSNSAGQSQENQLKGNIAELGLAKALECVADIVHKTPCFNSGIDPPVKAIRDEIFGHIDAYYELIQNQGDFSLNTDGILANISIPTLCQMVVVRPTQ